jgi:hypothetical protein
MQKWDQNSIDALKKFYRRYNLPSDSVIKDPQKIEDFTNKFNLENGYSFTQKEVADQILRIRKKGELPKLRR